VGIAKNLCVGSGGIYCVGQYAQFSSNDPQIRLLSTAPSGSNSSALYAAKSNMSSTEVISCSLGYEATTNNMALFSYIHSSPGSPSNCASVSLYNQPNLMNIYNGKVAVNITTASTSTSTGALVVTGGIGASSVYANSHDFGISTKLEFVQLLGGCGGDNAVLRFRKINNDFAILSYNTYQDNLGINSFTIGTSDIIPVAYRPYTDIWIPVMVIANGVKMNGQLHIFSTGFIQWYYPTGYVSGQFNGFYNSSVIYFLPAS